MNMGFMPNIGFIEGFDNKKKQYVGAGTGYLISPNLVLTGANAIYSIFKGREYENFRFYPKQWGVLENYIEVEAYFFPEKYMERGSVIYDYALLKLKEKVPDY
jgi:V8-like Glu-specific endopeptidase